MIQTLQAVVKSSNIQKVRWYAGDDLLEPTCYVTFTDDREYVYYGVPLEKVFDFLRAESQGKFLNEHIKPLYRSEKVGEVGP